MNETMSSLLPLRNIPREPTENAKIISDEKNHDIPKLSWKIHSIKLAVISSRNDSVHAHVFPIKN